MKNIKTVFGTVVYQKAYKYVNEFIESLNQQTGRFDVLIINDDCSVEEENVLYEKCEQNVVVVTPKMTMSPGELRIELMKEAKARGYDLLIIGDFDDLFEKNRVSRYQEEFSEEIHFMYNDLYDFSENKVLDGMPQKTDSIEDIIEYNYVGLSNSGLNLNHISMDFLENVKKDKIDIFDWYFYTRLLLTGAKGKLVAGTKTYYRLHDNNIAGVIKEIPTLEEIKYEIDVKIKHYTLLEKYAFVYTEKKEKYEQLSKYIDEIYITRDWVFDDYFWWGVTASL